MGLPVWKIVWWCLPYLEKELLYDSAIALVGTYPRELKTGSWRDICTSVFITDLLMGFKKWKWPKCPLTDEWISKMWSIRTPGILLGLTKEENPHTCYTMDGLVDIMLRNRSQSQHNKLWRQIVYDYHLYLETKKQNKWTVKKDRNRFISTENKLAVFKGEENWEVGADIREGEIEVWTSNYKSQGSKPQHRKHSQ